MTAVDEQVDPNRYPESSNLSPSCDFPRCFDVAAELYYYWINFSPLTRGSAVCGWSGMIATMLFLGYEVCVASFYYSSALRTILVVGTDANEQIIRSRSPSG